MLSVFLCKAMAAFAWSLCLCQRDKRHPCKTPRHVLWSAVTQKTIESRLHCSAVDALQNGLGTAESNLLCTNYHAVVALSSQSCAVACCSTVEPKLHRKLPTCTVQARSHLTCNRASYVTLPVVNSLQMHFQTLIAVGNTWHVAQTIDTLVPNGLNLCFL